MKIYVTGLIFFNGCNEPVKGMFAPDGTQDLPDGIPEHQASLWIAPEYVVEGSEAAWWPGRAGAVRSHDIDSDTVLEFRIMDPAKIEFPDLTGEEPNCDHLDEKLPKLKKKKKTTTTDFAIDLDAAETIAEVILRGGDVTPRLLNKKVRFVEWTITAPSGLQIIAKLQDDDSVAGIITLNDPAAEIVFSNTHDVFADDEEEKKDILRGNHVALFQKLNPEADISVFSQKAKKTAAPLTTENKFANYLLD